MICGHQFSRSYVVNHHVTFTCVLQVPCRLLDSKSFQEHSWVTYIPAQLHSWFVTTITKMPLYVCTTCKMVMHSCLRTFTNAHKVELHVLLAEYVDFTIFLPRTFTNVHKVCLYANLAHNSLKIFTNVYKVELHVLLAQYVNVCVLQTITKSRGGMELYICLPGKNLWMQKQLMIFCSSRHYIVTLVVPAVWVNDSKHYLIY